MITEDPFRIVVTAWRAWPAHGAGIIWDALNEATKAVWGTGRPILVAHGQCPDGGGDLWADLWALRAGNWIDDRHVPSVLSGPDPVWLPVPDREGLSGAWVLPERWPADWDQFGRAAGPRRNEAMVSAHPRADACLAFPGPGSRGTLGCLDLARRAGIPTKVIPWLEQGAR